MERSPSLNIFKPKAQGQKTKTKQKQKQASRGHQSYNFTIFHSECRKTGLGHGAILWKLLILLFIMKFNVSLEMHPGLTGRLLLLMLYQVPLNPLFFSPNIYLLKHLLST